MCHQIGTHAVKIMLATVALTVALSEIASAQFPFTPRSRNGNSAVYVASSQSPDFAVNDKITHVRTPGASGYVPVSDWNDLVTKANQLKDNLNRIEVYRIRGNNGDFFRVTLTGTSGTSAQPSLPFTARDNTYGNGVVVSASRTPQLSINDLVTHIRPVGVQYSRSIMNRSHLHTLAGQMMNAQNEVQVKRTRYGQMTWVTVTLTSSQSAAGSTAIGISNLLNQGQEIIIKKKSPGGSWQFVATMAPHDWSRGGRPTQRTFQANVGEIWGLFIQEYVSNFSQPIDREIKSLTINQTGTFHKLNAYIVDLP